MLFNVKKSGGHQIRHWRCSTWEDYDFRHPGNVISHRKCILSCIEWLPVLVFKTQTLKSLWTTTVFGRKNAADVKYVNDVVQFAGYAVTSVDAGCTLCAQTWNGSHADRTFASSATLSTTDAWTRTLRDVIVYTVSQKNPPCGFLTFFPRRLGIFNQFFTHLLQYHFYTRLQIVIQILVLHTR